MAEVLRPDGDGWRLGEAPWRPDNDFYAVIGDPVAHSLSPRMHAAALAERALPHRYVALRVTADELPALKARAADGRTGRLAGFNVTAPHKEAVAALCDGRTDQARALGAVNTVRVENGRWLGHNTDSGGLLAVLSQVWAPGEAVPPLGVVLGTGGSARAAVDALLRWGVESVEVRYRSEASGTRFAAWLEARGLADDIALSPLASEAEPMPEAPSAWICCLAGGVDARPFLPAAAGPETALLVDVRYGDQLPAGAPPLGFRYSDGLPLLLMQGGLSVAWWFGPPVPWAGMLGALPQR